MAYDLESTTIDALERRFAPEIANGRFSAINGDYLDAGSDEKIGLVLSCMFIEHLDDAHTNTFVRQAHASLIEGRRVISIVPASPAH